MSVLCLCASLALRFCAFDQQVDGIEVALKASSGDLGDAGFFGVADVTVRFARGDVADVDFDGRNADGAQGVGDGDAGVGVGGRVDDDAVARSQRLLDTVDDRALVVALEELTAHASALAVGADQFFQIGQRFMSVDFRLAAPEHVHVRAVDDKDVHSSSASLIFWAVSRALAPLQTVCSAQAR